MRLGQCCVDLYVNGNVLEGSHHFLPATTKLNRKLGQKVAPT